MNLTLLLKRGRLRAVAALVTLPMFGLSTLLLVVMASVQTGCVGHSRKASSPPESFSRVARASMSAMQCALGKIKSGRAATYTSKSPGEAPSRKRPRSSADAGNIRVPASSKSSTPGLPIPRRNGRRIAGGEETRSNRARTAIGAGRSKQF